MFFLVFINPFITFINSTTVIIIEDKNGKTCGAQKNYTAGTVEETKKAEENIERKRWHSKNGTKKIVFNGCHGNGEMCAHTCMRWRV